MTQKLCRRLEELEKISAAAAARRSSKNSDYERKIADMMEHVYAWHADPVNQKWLAEQPPDYVYHSVQALRAELQERASRHFRQVQTGGFR
jgi:hypothetical protein